MIIVPRYIVKQNLVAMRSLTPILILIRVAIYRTYTLLALHSNKILRFDIYTREKKFRTACATQRQSISALLCRLYRCFPSPKPSENQISCVYDEQKFKTVYDEIILMEHA